MLKELICAAALSGTIGITAPQNSNDGTYYQDVTITETYEYQTNEVNSADDLVVGNIYHYSFDRDVLTNIGVSVNIYTNTNEIFNFIASDVMNVSTGSGSFGEDYNCYISANYTQTVINQKAGNPNYTRGSLTYYKIDFDFIYRGRDIDTSNATLYGVVITKSDYLGEKTITITPKQFDGLFSIFDNFLHERLFSGGILDTTNVTVFNATMSLGQWLSTTTSIVLLSLIVLLLVLLIKFIFKYVGGMMIWRS